MTRHTWDDGLSPEHHKTFITRARRNADGSVTVTMTRRYRDPGTSSTHATAILPADYASCWTDDLLRLELEEIPVEIAFAERNVVHEMVDIPPMFVPGWQRTRHAALFGLRRRG